MSVDDGINGSSDPLAFALAFGCFSGSPDVTESFALDSSSSGIPLSQDQGVPIEDVPTGADSGYPNW